MNWLFTVKVVINYLTYMINDYLNKIGDESVFFFCTYYSKNNVTMKLSKIRYFSRNLKQHVLFDWYFIVVVMVYDPLTTKDYTETGHQFEISSERLMLLLKQNGNVGHLVIMNMYMYIRNKRCNLIGPLVHRRNYANHRKPPQTIFYICDNIRKGWQWIW